MTSDTAIKVAGLERAYKGGIKAVDGIDLHVHTGEVYGFLGPNGAGKSTVVRMLTTLLAPTAGSATVAGYDVVDEADAVRRHIGVALQDAAIDPFMTGRELLRLQGVLHGIRTTETDERADELLRRVDLLDAGDRQVGTYSGGMRRRLDLALALVHEPKVLFLDEPTTGLDPISRRTLWEEVRRLNAAGTTVFLTTQYLEEANELADRVGIIDGGRIVAEGTPAALRAEIGLPTLTVDVDDAEQVRRGREAIGTFGTLVETTEDRVAIRLPGGARAVAEVIRALDQSGVTVHRLELSEPSLDDVFMAKTGRHLEADESPAA